MVLLLCHINSLTEKVVAPHPPKKKKKSELLVKVNYNGQWFCYYVTLIV